LMSRALMPCRHIPLSILNQLLKIFVKSVKANLRGFPLFIVIEACI
jgi:hypothetical protein